MNVNSQRWYKEPRDNAPFKLSKVTTCPNQKLFCFACFPWTPNSLTSLWPGQALQDATLTTRWNELIEQWTGAIAVGGTGCLMIYPRLGPKNSLTISLPEPELEITHVAWAISSREPLRPLVVFTVTSVILIFDVTTRSIVGSLRGHGGPITSLTIHPSLPHLFCTTSRDHTARLYDLTLKPVQEPNNPHWPPQTSPSLAGPAHGLHFAGPEGKGIGQCVAVMVGQRSGGHQAAVMCAAFHPSAPLLATGGMDRAVKIWRIPPCVLAPFPDACTLFREDKPLFSGIFHKARVLTVSWLSENVLITSSAPALMQRYQTDPEETYMEEGTVAVWQWLGYRRFFPSDKLPMSVLRSTASDWHNSESYKMMCEYHLPMRVRHVHVYSSPDHDPLLLVPMGDTIRIFNIMHFEARSRPKFPVDDSIASLTQRLQLNDEEEVDSSRGWRSPPPPSSSESDGEHGEDEVGRVYDPSIEWPRAVDYPPPPPPRRLFDSVEGWAVKARSPRDGAEAPEITACAIGFEALRVVAIGQRAIYMWSLREGASV